MRVTMGMTMGMRAGHTSGNRTTSDSGSGNAWYCYLIVTSFTDEGRPPHLQSQPPVAYTFHAAAISHPSLHLPVGATLASRPLSTSLPIDVTERAVAIACKLE